MSDERHKIKYRLMEILDKLHVLRISFKLYVISEPLNPLTLWNAWRFQHRSHRDRILVPPRRLINLVSGNSDLAEFVYSGRCAAETIADVVTKNGRDISDFERILDFGCGCGRVITHLRSCTKAELYGTDWNQASVDWCKHHLDFAHFATNKLVPPLDYVSGFFDFVYALSVFTHLSEALQIDWMNELSRILKPGGLLLLTTHGEHYLERLSLQEREQFRHGHLIVKRTEHSGTTLCTAFHPEPYVRKELSKHFRVLDFIPMGAKGNPFQDVYLLSKVD